MKKLPSLTFLILVLLPVVTLPLHAQQAAQATKAPSSTPGAKRSSASGAATKSSSTSAAANKLPMPVEATPTTPVPARSAATSDTPPKPHANNWEIYPPAQMPAGKSLTEAEAAKLAAGDYSEKVLYLVGTFHVGAAQKDRAILWPGETLGPIHVVVSYPLSIPIPTEGSTIVRDAPIGYRITRIKHPSADEVTIFVRDVTLP